MIARYLKSIQVSVLTPWRAGRPCDQPATTRGAAAIAALHIVTAACLATTVANWVYLAGKGWQLGWGEMDLGEDDLPDISIGQLLQGLTASTVTWAIVLALVVGVCVVVADVIYMRDRAMFRRAVRSACVLTSWFVVWGGAAAIALYVQGGEIVQPARWPEGESLEARDRVIYLLVAYPILWAISLPAGDAGRLRGLGRRIAAVGCYGLIWTAFWRWLPWIAIEAYTG